jgi:hypothetical protein
MFDLTRSNLALVFSMANDALLDWHEAWAAS